MWKVTQNYPQINSRCAILVTIMSLGSFGRRFYAVFGIVVFSFGSIAAPVMVYAFEPGEGAADAGASIVGLPPAGETADEDAPEPASTAVGACGASIAGFMCQAITTILQFTADIMGVLVLGLVDILIAFAKYNGFSDATVVSMGWVVVRDVVNMFFIIILLISAFATIIGTPAEFHYKQVLPKLLLSAVLINFSKTLIQLLVDFSQVVMLTFVNAFVQAAAGNFVSALGLNRVLQIAQTGQVADGAGGVISAQNVITAFMLANFLLAIMLGVIIIMTAFLIVRIVVIWLSLIMSPIAFFATALPGSAKKALGAFTNDYWSRLTNALIGGPTMAFFLWLTLATVQASAGSAGGLAPALDFHPESAFTLAISSIGNTQDIASFIIGITLMLAGLQAAVSFSSTLGSAALKGFAAQVSQRAQQAGRFAAGLPYLAAGYGARQAGRGVAATARYADKRYQLTQRAATAVAGSRAGQLATRMPIVGERARQTLTKGMQGYDKEIAAGAKERMAYQSETLKRLPPEERDAYVASQLSRTPGSPEGKKAFQEFSDYVRSDDYRKGFEKRNEKKYVGGLVEKGLSEDDAKNASKVMVQQDAMKQEREAFQKDLEFARSRNDFQRVESLEKELKQKPYLAKDEAGRKAAAADLAKDAEKYKDISESDASNGLMLTEMLKANGYKVNEAGELIEVDKAASNDLDKAVARSKNQKLIQMVAAHKEFVARSPGIKESELTNLQHRFNPADGTVQSFDVSRDDKGAYNDNAGKRARNKNQQAAFNSLQEAGSKRTSGKDIDVAQAQQFFSNGGRLVEFAKITNNDLDQKPVQNLSASIGKDMESVLAEFNRKPADPKDEAAVKAQALAKEEAMAKFSEIPATVLSQTGDKNVTADVRIRIISQLGGERAGNLIENYSSLNQKGRAGLDKAIEQAIELSDDIRTKDAAKRSEEEKKVLALADKATELAQKRDSHVSPYIKQIVRSKGLKTE